MLEEKINSDYQTALEEKNEEQKSILRMLKSVLKNAEIANMRKKLKEEDVQKIVSTEIKKREEAAELYTQGGREELAVKERSEIDFLKKYLPEQLSEDKIAEIINSKLEKLEAAGPKDFGRLMGEVMKEVGNKADGTIVSRLVKKAIEEL